MRTSEPWVSEADPKGHGAIGVAGSDGDPVLSHSLCREPGRADGLSLAPELYVAFSLAYRAPST